MIPFLNPWFLLAALLALGGAGAYGYVTGESDGSGRVQTAWDRAEKVVQQARQARNERARQAERELQEKADEDRKKQQAAARDRDARIASLERELRDRPQRPAAGPAGVPAGPAGPGRADSDSHGEGTGAGLYRDDAEFLVGYARLAAAAVAERDACYRRYSAGDAQLRALAKEPRK